MSQILDRLTNASAIVERLDPTTGSYASVLAATNCVIIPANWRPTGPQAIPWLGDQYQGDPTDAIAIETTTQIQAGDKVTVTPTGGSAREYRALRPQVFQNVIAHQWIPLADYEPGG